MVDTAVVAKLIKLAKIGIAKPFYYMFEGISVQA